MPQYLYVIRRDDGVRKLGRSHNPQARMAQLYHAVSRDLADGLAVEYQIECPAGLIAKAETYAHSLMRKWRVEGEWFRIDAVMAQQAVDTAATLAVQDGGFPAPDIKRTTLMIQKDLFEDVTEYRFVQRHNSFNDAILDLIRVGLEASRRA
jgi:hypothetical protein